MISFCLSINSLVTKERLFWAKNRKVLIGVAVCGGIIGAIALLFATQPHLIEDNYVETTALLAFMATAAAAMMVIVVLWARLNYALLFLLPEGFQRLGLIVLIALLISVIAWSFGNHFPVGYHLDYQADILVKKHIAFFVSVIIFFLLGFSGYCASIITVLWIAEGFRRPNNYK